MPPHRGPRIDYTTQALLGGPGAQQNEKFASNGPKKDKIQFENIDIKVKFKSKKENQSTWRGAWKKIKTLAPFLWPKKDCPLQLRVVLCFVMLLLGRVVNLYVPIYNKKVVDSLTEVQGKEIEFRWDWILIYIAFKFLQGSGAGGMGLLNNIRSFLWIRVQQYTSREVQVELFRHLHSLSLRWHLDRRTGEVLRVLDRGTSSINDLLNMILFSMAPTILDLLIAVIYFVAAFNYWFGIIVFVSIVCYMAMTITIQEWRAKYRRKMNLADNETRARSVDSLLNFETVKYYGNEQYEVRHFREAVVQYQKEEFKVNITVNMMHTIQNLLLCLGLLAGSLLAAYMIAVKKELKVGDYVLFASYMVQLYTPLNMFGMQYRQIQNNFVDMENMFDLLRQEQEVSDAKDAAILDVKGGGVEFQNVSFQYIPEKVILKDVSFSVPPGKTVALVGPSGSGKSTIIRLLFRFYDVNSGSILIDKQDVKSVTQDSLRKAIGVVPQDTVLFNNTIKYNVEYGNLEANDSEVIEAAKGADIHKRIMTFPQEYETQVGERGLRLSGGEKQRVAIARTILKAPKIILLDEATSALDTHTERNIQDSLNKMCTNRTTIIVAHRLSTIIHADEILVLQEGVIVERGRHDELVSRNGIYASMWQQQLENNTENSSATLTEIPEENNQDETQQRNGPPPPGDSREHGPSCEISTPRHGEPPKGVD